MNLIVSETDKKAILNILTKNGKGIRTSKPKINEEDPNTGRSAYVWRNVMFVISKNSVHHCMPVCADFYLCQTDWDDRKNVMNELNDIVEEVVNSVPKSEWYGVRRWARALGR